MFTDKKVMMLLWLCMAAALTAQKTVCAEPIIRMIAVNNEQDAISIAQSKDIISLKKELSKHVITLPDSKEGKFAVDLPQQDAGFIPPAVITCGSALAIIAEENESIVSLSTPTGFKKYLITVGSGVPAVPQLIPDNHVIIIDDKTNIGHELCTTPSTTITISLMPDKGTPLHFIAEKIKPADSFTVVGHTKDDAKADFLSKVKNYEEFSKEQNALVRFAGELNKSCATASLECGSNIVIAAFNKVSGIRVRLKDAGYDSYDILLNNAQINKPLSLAANDPSRIKIYSKEEAINYFGRDICHAEQGKLIQVELQNPEQNKYEEYYIRSKNRYVAYNSQADIEGVWFPVGIIAGKPRRTASGITFSAFPISVALGMRRYSEDGSFYVGGSILGSYALGETNKDQTTTATTESKTFHGAAAGILLDINSYFYLMGAYQWSFVQDTKNPGWLIGIGLGAKLSSILAGK
jgi:hypothetical protein